MKITDIALIIPTIAVTLATPLVAAADVNSGSGRDHVTITVRKGAASDLKKTGQYHQIFISGEPSQDRSLCETNHGTSLRAFNSNQVAQDNKIEQDATLTFRASYSSVFGTFWMNNGVDTWTVQHIDPGDEVEFRWAP